MLKIMYFRLSLTFYKTKQTIIHYKITALTKDRWMAQDFFVDHIPPFLCRYCQLMHHFDPTSDTLHFGGPARCHKDIVIYGCMFSFVASTVNLFQFNITLVLGGGGLLLLKLTAEERRASPARSLLPFTHNTVECIEQVWISNLGRLSYVVSNRRRHGGKSAHLIINLLGTLRECPSDFK